MDPLPSYDRRRSRVQGRFRLLERLIDVLLPVVCLSCRQDRGLAPLGLCRRCRSGLRAARPDRRCRGCGRELTALAAAAGGSGAGYRGPWCGECRARPPRIDRLFFLYDYRPPFDAVIHAFKYGGLEYLGSNLADLGFQHYADELRSFDLLVPVPLHRFRRWRRGYNQAETMARRLSQRLDIPCRGVLRRRAGPPQSQMALDDRRRNARRILALDRAPALAALRVLLVDDVTTSGATLAASAHLLLQAGAAAVSAFVAARTPDPG